MTEPPYTSEQVRRGRDLVRRDALLHVALGDLMLEVAPMTPPQDGARRHEADVLALFADEIGVSFATAREYRDVAANFPQSARTALEQIDVVIPYSVLRKAAKYKGGGFTLHERWEALLVEARRAARTGRKKITEAEYLAQLGVDTSVTSEQWIHDQIPLDVFAEGFTDDAAVRRARAEPGMVNFARHIIFGSSGGATKRRPAIDGQARTDELASTSEEAFSASVAHGEDVAPLLSPQDALVLIENARDDLHNVLRALPDRSITREQQALLVAAVRNLRQECDVYLQGTQAAVPQQYAPAPLPT